MLGRDNSIVTDLFCGQLQSKIICGECKYESLAFDNFWDLSVSFTRSLNKLDGCELTRMIEHFLKEEVLDDLFYCEKCKKRTKSTKKFVFWRLPKILVIHLKRFLFGKFKREKINQNVIFPVDNLDLSEFIKESSNLVKSVYLSQADSSVKDPRYTLFGIVNHSGSLYGGHYTA
jgi:Ubiquitin C-terminal hydrolase